MTKHDPQRAAKALILFKNKYLLLLRNDEEDISPSEWDIPGGGLEPGESANKALIREVKEETGIDISFSKIFPIKNWKIDKGGINIGGTDFLCILSNSQEIILSAEHIRAQWFSEKEIFDSGEIPDWIKEDVELTNRLTKEF